MSCRSLLLLGRLYSTSEAQLRSSLGCSLSDSEIADFTTAAYDDLDAGEFVGADEVHFAVRPLARRSVQNCSNLWCRSLT